MIRHNAVIIVPHRRYGTVEDEHLIQNENWEVGVKKFPQGTIT